ncbi:DinB family protein [Spirosoma sp. KNUC1025]|uniref:DinB family protein n=1 Tax=Spirosoma sp. KNUC1025 TaxID=2894082 RepID=UPI00386C8514|nr:DinB family protein [Spirosoma sp. KNUC1025]
MPPLESREVWLRGPLSDVPPLLQPVAHALLQAREEVMALMQDFPEDRLWDRPNNVASVGFHLQHLTGVLDRTFTYARNEALSPVQLVALASEGNSDQPTPSAQELVHRFGEQVDRALTQLRTTDELTLTEARGVGRAKLPSTVIGLLVHAAEHTMRHVGQLSVTVRALTL